MPDFLFSASAQQGSIRLSDNVMLHKTLELDWSATELGPIQSWPETLRSTIRLVLTSSMPLALLIGPSGVLIYNDAIMRIFSGIGSDGLGRSVLDVLSDAASFYQDVIASCATGETRSFRDQPLKIERNGHLETACFDLDFTPVINHDGTHNVVMIHAFETTEKVRTRRALERSQERLRMALDASDMIGIWDFDIASGLVSVDDRFIELFGIEGSWSPDALPLAAFTDRIHSSDRERVVKEIEIAIRTRTDFRSQYQVTDSAGQARFVLASGRTVLDASGTLIRFPGVAVEVTSQVEANAALAESEARFRGLAETVPQIVWSSDGDGQHDYFSSRWYEFTGQDPAAPDNDIWKDLIHPDDKERVLKVWDNARATGAPYEIEYRFRHHSGVYRWLLVMAMPQRDATGRITRWFGTSTDIHESRLISAERDIIAHELNHRIKNLFALFGALISLSARSAHDIKSYAANLNGRITALSKAHDFVRPASGLLPAQTLHALLQSLLSPYANTQAPQLTLEGQDVLLSEGAATSFALIFHELATNAAKYGALSVPTGHVWLTTRLENDRVKATWKETGISTAPQSPASGGFGSRLLALMVEGQMHGTADRYWEADGLRVEIDIPAVSIAPVRKNSPDKATSPSPVLVGATESETR